MSEKDRKLIIVAILICGLLIVVTLLVVLWPREAFEVSVKHHSSDTQTDSTQSTLSPMMTVNINTAEADELMVLPEMTRDIAVNIVQYRFEYGRFLTVEEIRRVDGVTWELYAAWSSYIFI